MIITYEDVTILKANWIREGQYHTEYFFCFQMSISWITIFYGALEKPTIKQDVISTQSTRKNDTKEKWKLWRKMDPESFFVFSCDD